MASIGFFDLDHSDTKKRSAKKNASRYERTLIARAKLARKAGRFLGVDYLDTFCATDPEGEYYPDELRNFKKLVGSGDKDLLKAAWNNTVVRNIEAVREEDFTPEEYGFLRRRCDKYMACNDFNPNKRILTERLIISPVFEWKDKQYFTEHLKEDGDIERYASVTPEECRYEAFAMPGNYKFTVYERKSKKLIGSVGFHGLDETRRIAKAEWYIIKPYRRMGYAREAVTALADYLFRGKLCELVESISTDDVYYRHYPKIDLIRAEIHADNEPSHRLAESCGFEFDFIDRRFFYIKGSDGRTVDGAIYYLTPDKLRK